MVISFIPGKGRGLRDQNYWMSFYLKGGGDFKRPPHYTDRSHVVRHIFPKYILSKDSFAMRLSHTLESLLNLELNLHIYLNSSFAQYFSPSRIFYKESSRNRHARNVAAVELTSIPSRDIYF